jgi:hypothetical protein
MPGGKRSAHKDLAAAKLAAGGTVAEAAAAAGVDERTIYKWKADDTRFGERVAELRAAAVAAAMGKLSDSMAGAAGVLSELLGADDANVRLRAARAVIELGLKVREQCDLAERLAALEAALKGKSDGDSDRGAAAAGGEGGREECGHAGA